MKRKQKRKEETDIVLARVKRRSGTGSGQRIHLQGLSRTIGRREDEHTFDGARSSGEGLGRRHAQN